jgi:DNA repair exonuclease SbcCD ATPase subunit
MSLTRKALKAMGLTDEQIDSVIEMHTDTVSGLKDKLEAAENNSKDVEKLTAEVEKYKNELEKANKAITESEKLKEQYENTKSEYEKYKGEIAAKEMKTAKEKAVREYFKSKGINDDNMSIAMRGSRSEIDAMELDEKGKIKDTKVFDELIKGDYAKLISHTEVKGVQTQVLPPNATNKKVMTWEDIDKIKDVKERQQAMYENRETLGIR